MEPLGSVRTGALSSGRLLCAVWCRSPRVLPSAAPWGCTWVGLTARLSAPWYSAESLGVGRFWEDPGGHPGPRHRSVLATCAPTSRTALGWRQSRPMLISRTRTMWTASILGTTLESFSFLYALSSFSRFVLSMPHQHGRRSILVSIWGLQSERTFNRRYRSWQCRLVLNMLLLRPVAYYVGRPMLMLRLYLVVCSQSQPECSRRSGV